MKKVTVSVEIGINDLAAIIAEELGLERVKLPKIARSERSRPPARPAITTQIPSIEQAIEDVINATNRVDRDQYTSGVQSALNQLFEAAKRLRRAAIEARKSANSEGALQ